MRTIKILLGIVGVLAVLLVVGGIVWWRRSGKEMVETVRVARLDGTRFGQSATADQCIDETVRRLGPEEFSFSGMLVHTSFLGSCSAVASELDAVCERQRGVGIQERLSRYIELCRIRNAKNPLCPQVLQALDGICRKRLSGGPVV